MKIFRGKLIVAVPGIKFYSAPLHVTDNNRMKIKQIQCGQKSSYLRPCGTRDINGGCIFWSVKFLQQTGKLGYNIRL